MAIQLSVTVRNAMLDAIETATGATAKLAIFTGAVPANCAAADPSGELVRMTLPANWMNDAGSGQKTYIATWSATASAGSGATPQSFRIYANDGTTCHLQGTCAIGSGDLSVNGTITSGQTVTVTQFTLTAANS